jgi:uncharacterized protein YceK
MITREQARQSVVERLSSWRGSRKGDSLVVDDKATIEKPWGWVFLYTSRLWQETGDDRYLLGGNAPFIVERESGRMLVLGTALPLEHYVAFYEKYGDPHFQPGPGLRLVSCPKNVDRTAATKLLRDRCGAGLLVAKQQINDCIEGGKPCVTALDVLSADALAQELESLCFVVERLANKATNDLYMKAIPVCVLCLLLLGNGCMTMTTLDAAKEQTHKNVKGEVVVDQKAKPAYYAVVPFAAVGDILLLPFGLIIWTMTAASGIKC